MALVWYLDRALALVGYAALYLSVLTGILYNAQDFGTVSTASRRIHVEVSVFATLVLIAHAVVGVLDVGLVAAGEAPIPDYGIAYLVTGSAVGAGAFLLLVVGVLGFVDASRFERPWTPRVVHAFTYGAFAFGTIHAAAVGTDLVAVLRPGVVAGTVLLAYVLALRTGSRFGFCWGGDESTTSDSTQ